jgi:hypothetical protein
MHVPVRHFMAAGASLVERGPGRLHFISSRSNLGTTTLPAELQGRLPNSNLPSHSQKLIG